MRTAWSRGVFITPTIATFCYVSKQHFASKKLHTAPMRTPTLNDILAENLAQKMADKGHTQASLAKLSGVGQTTISLYLNPSRRQPSKSGKVPSAKFSEVESLADALGVPAWSLLIPETAYAGKQHPEGEPQSRRTSQTDNLADQLDKLLPEPSLDDDAKGRQRRRPK